MVYLSYKGAYGLAVLPGNLFSRYSSSRLLAVKETKLYKILTYGPHAARGYRVKLQR